MLQPVTVCWVRSIPALGSRCSSRSDALPSPQPGCPAPGQRSGTSLVPRVLGEPSATGLVPRVLGKLPGCLLEEPWTSWEAGEPRVAASGLSCHGFRRVLALPTGAVAEKPCVLAGVQAPGVKPLPEAQRESRGCLQGCERKEGAQQPPHQARSRGGLSWDGRSHGPFVPISSPCPAAREHPQPRDGSCPVGASNHHVGTDAGHSASPVPLERAKSHPFTPLIGSRCMQRDLQQLLLFQAGHNGSEIVFPMPDHRAGSPCKRGVS